MAQRHVRLYAPHPAQQQVHNALDGDAEWIASGGKRGTPPHRYVVVDAGRRWGKTNGVGLNHVNKECLSKINQKWFWVDPSFPIGERAWRDFKKLVRPLVQQKMITTRETNPRLATFATGSTIQFLSAENVDSLVGDGLDGVVCNEAAQFRREAWEMALKPALMDLLGQALFLSTPRGFNFFWELHQRGQNPKFQNMAHPPKWKRGFKSFTFPSSSNPFLPKSEIEEARLTLPARIFAQEYLADFKEGGASVFQGVSEIFHTGIHLDGGNVVARNHPYVAGLDLGRVRDFTVLTILDKYGRVCWWERLPHVDWGAQFTFISRAVQRYSSLILLDETGLGDPIIEQMRNKTNVTVDGYKITTNRYKVELIQNLAVMIENGEIVIPGELTVLKDELLAYTYTHTDGGAVKFSAPSGQHDDCVISLALAAWAYKKWIGSAHNLPVVQGLRVSDLLWQGEAA